MKDMSFKAYFDAIERAGGRFSDFGGYVHFTRADGANIGISQHNFPGSRRHKLACLLAERDRHFNRFERDKEGVK